MKKLKDLLEIKERALTSRVYFYYDSFIKKYIVGYSFEMPKRFYITDDFLKDNRFYDDRKIAITEAKKLASSLGVKYTGREWCLEFNID